MAGPELRIVLIHRRTRLADLIARHNTADQARFYVERLGGDFEDYVREDARYRAVLTQAEQTLRTWAGSSPWSAASCPTTCSAPTTWWSWSARTGWWPTP